MSRPEQLLLPRQFHTAMIQQAQAELPNECCGLLAGTRDGATLRALARHALVNEAASPVAYLSEPRSMFAAMKEMRRLNQDIVAIYHSHPTSAAIPSKTDLQLCYSPDIVHLIISLKEDVPEVRGWWLTESTFEEADWRLMDE